MGRSKEEAQSEERFFDRAREERREKEFLETPGEPARVLMPDDERDVPKWQTEFDRYVEGKEHYDDCGLTYSDRHHCCLEKVWIKNFIEKQITKAYITGATEERQRISESPWTAISEALDGLKDKEVKE